ncbi:ubiquitin-like domain-containing protein [Streptomyces xanthophaeus]|uniref:ubiquitin-like domain-containing protein n=1 Tax=Streptomyces xanthophaeus TaxID=67385 RepID=UPI00399000FF
MSDTQGSHRRGGPVPGSYGAGQPDWPPTLPDPGPMAWPAADPGPLAWPAADPGPLTWPAADPGPLAWSAAEAAAGDTEPGVPAPRASRRRARGPEPQPAAAAPGTGRRRSPGEPGGPAAGEPAPSGPGRRRGAAADAGDLAAAAAGTGSGRRRGGAADTATPPAPGTGRRRGGPEAGDAGSLTLPAPAGPGRRRGGGQPAPEPGTAPNGRAHRRAATGARTTGTGLLPAPAPAGNWRRIVPQALVVAFLAGGTTAFVAADKAVRLTVDGVPRTLHTFADGVDELLVAEGLGVGPHDLVAPAPGTPIEDGEEIVVRYGRPLRLTVDGQQRQVWTTARTVDGALRQFGIRAEGAYLSAPRTASVPRAGLTLSVRTERSVTFMADGRERTIRTNAATVGEALGQAGITLQGQDTTSVPPGSFPRDGQTVTVLRITGTREVREERIPYATERAEDDSLFAGTEVVERAGRPGARRVTYSLRTVNGVRQQPRRVAEETIREPVTQLVKVGTRPLPTSVSGADGLNWAALAQCESGGRPSATDPSGTYGGLYQFDVRTWQGLGGSGRPQDASGAEQTYRAKKLYVQRGASPWPHCGRRLTRG